MSCYLCRYLSCSGLFWTTDPKPWKWEWLPWPCSSYPNPLQIVWSACSGTCSLSPASSYTTSTTLQSSLWDQPLTLAILVCKSHSTQPRALTYTNVKALVEFPVYYTFKLKRLVSINKVDELITKDFRKSVTSVWPAW